MQSKDGANGLAVELQFLMAMRIGFFDTHAFEREPFERIGRDFSHSLTFFEPRLTPLTAGLARGYLAVCAFANDNLGSETLTTLREGGTKLIALRSAGFNHVDLAAAERLGITVVRVPKYSPYSVAEHAACLLLALNRKVHRAYARVRELNFSLDGLVGFDLHGKTVGVVGTGRIGGAFCRIMLGFGCRVLAHDLTPDEQLATLPGLHYVPLANLISQSDVISLHVPLIPATRHLIDDAAFTSMKHGVYLINTGRGALVDTKALITHLKRGKIGAAGLDVYEEEEEVFFKDLSIQGLQDDQLARLLTFPNVLVTSHQGFLTREALEAIARTTLENVAEFERGDRLSHQVLRT